MVEPTVEVHSDNTVVDEKTYEEVDFKFKYHQTKHAQTKVRQKHTHHKHVREVFEKEIPLQLEIGSPPTKGIFCNKCNNRGYHATTLMIKGSKVQYFGPVFCNCVLKHLYIEEVSTASPGNVEPTKYI